MRLLTVLLLACQLMVWQGYAGVFDCGCMSEKEVASDCCSSGCTEEESQSIPENETCLCCITHETPLAAAEWTTLELPVGSKLSIDSAVLLKPVAVIDTNLVRRPLALKDVSPCISSTSLQPVTSSWLL